MITGWLTSFVSGNFTHRAGVDRNNKNVEQTLVWKFRENVSETRDVEKTFGKRSKRIPANPEYAVNVSRTFVQRRMAPKRYPKRPSNVFLTVFY